MVHDIRAVAHCRGLQMQGCNENALHQGQAMTWQGKHGVLTKNA